jgi:predicted MPP superfamily phosphohydrolase
MKKLNTLPFISLIISTIFSTLVLLLRPLWYDISHFLGTNFPVMLSAAIFGAAGIVYSLSQLIRRKPGKKLAKGHLIGFLAINVVMVVLLFILLTELGSERVIIARNAPRYLPPALWLVGAGLLLWLGPIWNPLQSKAVRIALIAVFALSAGLWISLPWQVEMTSTPVVFVVQDGLSIVWGTNMRATGLLELGTDETLGTTRIQQANGLKTLHDGVQNVFVPEKTIKGDLFFKAISEGVRNIFPTSAVKTGLVESNIMAVALPEAGKEISLLAFSDIHEQDGNYAQMTENLSWEGVDLALYIGDILNNTDSAKQATRSLLSLSTGGETIPRVFARGNHETRGEAARLLDDWLLPEGQSWYFTFEAGNTFFIVLDSAEDKPDNDVEYSGLVDFKDYHQEQLAWLEEVLQSEAYQTAQYQVVLMHIPPHQETTPEFRPVVDLLSNKTGIDLVLSGHIHEGRVWMPEETDLPFPVATCGGSAKDDMVALKVDLMADQIRIDVIDIEGNIVQQENWAGQ